MTTSNKSFVRRGKVGRLAAGAIAAALVITMPTLPAYADDSALADHADRVAEQVSQAAPDNATPVPGDQANGTVKHTAESVATTVPLASGSAIEVQVNIEGEPLSAEITLPTGSTLSDGALAQDGTVVYPNASDAGSVAVQTLEGGETRIQTVIPNAEAQHEFGYGMEGYRATIDLNGEAAFVATTSEGAYIPVEAAWAVDANGKTVETHYEVRDDKLYQVVVPTADTAYPVVADPTWGWRNAAWGVTLSRTETSRIKDYAAAASFCAALVKNQKLTLACGVWSGYLQVQAATANNLSPKGCLHIVAAPLPGAITHTYC